MNDSEVIAKLREMGDEDIADETVLEVGMMPVLLNLLEDSKPIETENNGYTGFECRICESDWYPDQEEWHSKDCAYNAAMAKARRIVE